MVYQELYVKIEDFAQSLEGCKAAKVFYRIVTEQAEIWDERPVRLQDGTIAEREKVKGFRYSTKITLTALGFQPTEGEKLNPLNPPKPDTQLVFSDTLADRDCWTRQESEAYGAEVDAGWKAVLTQVKTVWKKSAFFEGVASILLPTPQG